MNKLLKLISNPKKIILYFIKLKYISILFPSKIYLKIVYYLTMGKRLNLNKPLSFTEKMQWLKLYNHNPLYTEMVDKFEVKKIVARIIGEEYIIPTLGVWDKFDEIDFDSLPEQFVLKCTHDSGGLVICKDKKNFNIKAAKKKINKCLKVNYYLKYREWPYKNVKPRIIAEKYMEDMKTKELRDYKFFTFNGKVKALFIASERQNVKTDTKFDFFDENYVHLPFTNGHPNADVLPEKPIHFDEMKILSEKLATDIPMVRCDFYEVNGKVYFGELTFCHWSGLMPFDPPEWDIKLGNFIELPNKIYN